MVKRLADRRTALAAVLLLQAALLAYNSFVSSCVDHEAGHVAAGLTHLRTGNFSVFSVNPPLYRLVAALPLSAITLKVFEPYSNGARLMPRWEYQAEEHFLEENPDKWMNCVRVARVASVGFSLVGTVVCYLWSAQCFGVLAGVLAAILFAFCPYILGHGCFVEPDVPAAAIGAAAMYLAWRWLRYPRWFEALVMGLVLGLAELCKYTLLIFYPLIPVLWIAYRWSEHPSKRNWGRQAAMLGTAMLVSLFVINLGFNFKGSFRPLGEFKFRTMMLTGHASLTDIPPEGGNRFAMSWLGMLPTFLPSDMVQGIDTQKYDFEHGLLSYLNGEWANHGWWYFYLYALALKMPLGTWILMGCAIALTIQGCANYGVTPNARQPFSLRDEMVILAPAIVIVLFVSSQTGFSIHSRYIIPALPFLFIWMSKVALVFEERRRTLASVVSIALLWSIGSSLAIYPHDLSYFNELTALLPTPSDTRPISMSGNLFSTIISAGPRYGPTHFLDSNIDWGQDLLYLKNWLSDHPDVRLNGLSCTCSYPVTALNLPAVPAPPAMRGEGDSLQPGWYAISVGKIFSQERSYRYFLNFEPVARAGYSIYIYNITAADVDRVRQLLKLHRSEL